jgi:Holliday junction resolvase RusA-like endonuclease
LYFDILKNYKIFKSGNKYSNEFKNNFNIHTFNIYYDFYLKFNDNYTSIDLDNLYKEIYDIMTRQKEIEDNIIS